MRKFIICFVLLFIIFPFHVNALDGEKNVTLSNCVDANSARFMLDKTEIKVKFIGIDSYDIIYDDFNDEVNGKLVNDYVCSVLTNAKEIKIEYEPNSDEKDKYGRTIAWVFVDGILLQENLVELGYSKIAYLYDDYKYTDKLKSAEELAKENKAGIWYESVVDENTDELFEENNIDDSYEENNDTVFSRILAFINEIFEKLLKLIDDLINEVL